MMSDYWWSKQIPNNFAVPTCPPLKRGWLESNQMCIVLEIATQNLNYEAQILSNPQVSDNTFNLNPPAFGDLGDACQFHAAGDGLRANPPVAFADCGFRQTVLKIILYVLYAKKTTPLSPTSRVFLQERVHLD
jgi:hypothetical protein